MRNSKALVLLTYLPGKLRTKCFKLSDITFIEREEKIFEPNAWWPVKWVQDRMDKLKGGFRTSLHNDATANLLALRSYILSPPTEHWLLNREHGWRAPLPIDLPPGLHRPNIARNSCSMEHIRLEPEMNVSYILETWVGGKRFTL